MSIYHKNKEEWVGQKINNLTIIDKVGEYQFTSKTKCGTDIKNYTYTADLLLVKCEKCNIDFQVKSRSLVGNKPVGCRHCAQRKDVIGKCKGSLVVESYEFGRRPNGRSILYYICKCACGNIKRTKADIFNIGECNTCDKCRKSSKFIRTKKEINLKRYFSNLKSNAKIRQLDFNIQSDDLIQLLIKQNYKCKLSGILISIENGTASLDRIDGSKGYNINNIQWVHRTINFMKNELSDIEFIKFCSYVHNYQHHEVS